MPTRCQKQTLASLSAAHGPVSLNNKSYNELECSNNADVAPPEQIAGISGEGEVTENMKGEKMLNDEIKLSVEN